MKVITLTLNPAFDMHCTTENFRLGHESFFDVLSFEAGGKGINISRALKENGVNSTAIVVVGNDNGQEFITKLDNDNINYIPIYVDGRIRENIILHDNSTVETRVSFNGFTVGKELLNAVEDCIDKVDDKTFITLTGSNPNGLDINEVKNFVKRLKERGAKIIIDSRSFSLEDLFDVKPFLIKPNKDELEKYIGREVLSIEDGICVAKELHSNGIENAMISLGESGAILSCDEGDFFIETPNIKIKSTIGAGDSSIAGFIKAYIDKKDKKNCLKTAVAFGTSACLTNGTVPPSEKEVEEIFNKIK